MAILTPCDAGIEFVMDASVLEARVSERGQAEGHREVCRELFDRIGAEFSCAMFRLLSSGMAREDFPRFEGQALKVSQACLRVVLKAGIESLDDGEQHVDCGGRRHWRVALTPRKIMTSAGEVEYSRPRYRSGSGASVVPVDDRVSFAGGYFTELAAAQGVFMMSGLSPRECVSLYGKLGIEGASVSSLQRLAEEAGRHWSGCAEDALATIRAKEAVPAEAASVCISLDGTMLPMIPAKGDGKATEWKEASVATMTCYDAEGERLHSLYLGQMPEPRKSTLKHQLEAELAHVVERRPDLRVTAVADAAADNWTFLSSLVPARDQLIDFWHACQHLGAAAGHIFPNDGAVRERWFQKYRHILRDQPEGVETVIRSLRYYHSRSVWPDPGIERELNYFRNHRKRMNYSRHQKLNLPIGNGVTESACKTLIGGRMKRSGQRWGMQGGKAILAIRALVKSRRFDAAWGEIVAHVKARNADNDNPSPAQLMAA